MAVSLIVTLTPAYPKTLPSLRLTDTDYLPESCHNRITIILETLPQTLVGAEMMYDIATPIRDVLEEAVQAQIRGEALPSLEEERAIKETAELEAEKLRRQELERQQQEISREEERVLKQMMFEEVDRQRRRLNATNQDDGRKSEEEDAVVDGSPEDGSDHVHFDHRTEYRDDAGNLIPFRSVKILAKMHQGPVTEVWTGQPLVRGHDARSTLLVVKQTTVRSLELTGKDVKSDIFELEKELEMLSRLRASSHPNVLDVLNFKIEKQVTNDGKNAGSWTVKVLTEHANKGSLEDLLEMVGSLGADKVRAWTIQLLEALEFYHCNGVIHGTVHPGNILLFRTASAAAIVKLADGGYQRRLHRMGNRGRASAIYSSAQSAFWVPSELAEDSESRYNRKSDIWDCGVVVLQMALGLAIVQQYTSFTTLLESLSLSSSLEDFIRRLFKSDSRKRPTAFDLLTSEFLRSNDPILVPRPPLTESKLAPSTPSMAPPLGRLRHDSMNFASGFTRYSHEFHELGRLGKGGFGEVFKARNKLDGQLYAIKKVTQNSPGSLSDVLSETMLLSRLNHPYVVRYFNSWLEEDMLATSDTEEDVVSFDSSTSQMTRPTIEVGHSTGGLDILSSAGGPQVEFAYDSEDGTSSSHEEDLAVDGSPQPAKKEEVIPLRRTISSPTPQRLLRSTLYIQMEYCEKHVSISLLVEALSLTSSKDASRFN